MNNTPAPSPAVPAPAAPPMPSHDLGVRYRPLGGAVEADGVRTYSARDVATGADVMVHLLDDANPAARGAIARQVALLAAGGQSRVLDTVLLPAGHAVVTDDIPGLTSFPAWLAERAGGAAPAPAALDASGPPLAIERAVGDGRAPGEPGSFTRLFVAGGRVIVDDCSPAAPPTSASPAAPAAQPALAPGEFTRLFQASPPAPGGPPSASPLVAPPPALVAPSAPSATPPVTGPVAPPPAPAPTERAFLPPPAAPRSPRAVRRAAATPRGARGRARIRRAAAVLAARRAARRRAADRRDAVGGGREQRVHADDPAERAAPAAGRAAERPRGAGARRAPGRRPAAAGGGAQRHRPAGGGARAVLRAPPGPRARPGAARRCAA